MTEEPHVCSSPLSHLALMRLCARSLVSVFSSSVRGGGGVAEQEGSGHSFSRIMSTYEAICASVGFILLRKEFTFLGRGERNVRGDLPTRWEQPNQDVQTHFFKMGMTGFRMASKIFRRMEFPVHTTPALASKSINTFANIEVLRCKNKKINMPFAHSG